jgi:hypothetical protein
VQEPSQAPGTFSNSFPRCIGVCTISGNFVEEICASSFPFSLLISAAAAPSSVAASKCLRQASILTEEAPWPQQGMPLQKRSEQAH